MMNLTIRAWALIALVGIACVPASAQGTGFSNYSGDGRAYVDSLGVAHCFGTTDDDAFYALGRAQATWVPRALMENLATARGEAAKYFYSQSVGIPYDEDSYVASDLMVKRWGMSDLVEQFQINWLAQRPDVHAAVTAFVAGVNDGLQEWQFYSSSVNGQPIADFLPQSDCVKPFMNDATSDQLNAFINDGVTVLDVLKYANYLNTLRSATTIENAIYAGAELQIVTGQSNMWSVPPSANNQSGSGPMLMVDQHVGIFDAYSRCFLVQIEGANYKAMGYTSPGLPFLWVGATPDIAWGFTTNSADVHDIWEATAVENSGVWEVPVTAGPQSGSGAKVEIVRSDLDVEIWGDPMGYSAESYVVDYGVFPQATWGVRSLPAFPQDPDMLSGATSHTFYVARTTCNSANRNLVEVLWDCATATTAQGFRDALLVDPPGGVPWPTNSPDAPQVSQDTYQCVDRHGATALVYVARSPDGRDPNTYDYDDVAPFLDLADSGAWWPQVPTLHAAPSLVSSAATEPWIACNARIERAVGTAASSLPPISPLVSTPGFGDHFRQFRAEEIIWGTTAPIDRAFIESTAVDTKNNWAAAYLPPLIDVLENSPIGAQVMASGPIQSIKSWIAAGARADRDEVGAFWAEAVWRRANYYIRNEQLSSPPPPPLTPWGELLHNTNTYFPMNTFTSTVSGPPSMGDHRFVPPLSWPQPLVNPIASNYDANPEIAPLIQAFFEIIVDPNVDLNRDLSSLDLYEIYPGPSSPAVNKLSGIGLVDHQYPFQGLTTGVPTWGTINMLDIGPNQTDAAYLHPMDGHWSALKLVGPASIEDSSEWTSLHRDNTDRKGGASSFWSCSGSTVDEALGSTVGAPFFSEAVYGPGDTTTAGSKVWLRASMAYGSRCSLSVELDGAAGVPPSVRIRGVQGCAENWYGTGYAWNSGATYPAHMGSYDIRYRPMQTELDCTYADVLMTEAALIADGALLADYANIYGP